MGMKPSYFRPRGLSKATPISESATCVILDINLKDGSGIDLRKGLKAAGVSLPVIYISGNENPAVREAALQSGCAAFLSKPFSAQELLEALKRAATRSADS
jgi:FixJ family two-component response regulator